VLKLLLATAALLASWFWARAYFSRVIDGTESITKGALAMRVVALFGSIIWFMRAVFGVLGSLFGLLVVAAVVGLVVKFAMDALQIGRSAAPPEPGAEPKRENDL
jgi:hypothetical protein